MITNLTSRKYIISLNSIQDTIHQAEEQGGGKKEAAAVNAAAFNDELTKKYYGFYQSLYKWRWSTRTMDKKREDNIDSKKLKKSRATKKFIETDKIPGAFLCFAYEMKTTSPLVFWVYTGHQPTSTGFHAH